MLNLRLNLFIVRDVFPHTALCGVSSLSAYWALKWRQVLSTYGRIFSESVLTDAMESVLWSGII
jgi:hypothetical protein